MRRQLSLLLTLTAWLVATGSQWDLVQTFAWGRMFVLNVQSMPLMQAAKHTFSPEGRCEICRAVAAAKQQEEDSPAVPNGKSDGKIFLFHQPAPVPVVVAPDFSPWFRSSQLVLAMTRAAPPVPPPRV